MKKFWAAFLVLICLAAVFAETVKLGKAGDYTIIIPEKATKQEKYSAALLAEYLEKLYKTRVPVVAENGKPAGSFISVGETASAKCNGFTAVLKPQGYSLKVKNGNLFIRGGFPGPLNGVLCFLEEDLGCRWYAEPYDIKGHSEPGLRIIPNLADKKLQVSPREYTPQFTMRGIRYTYGFRANEESVLFFRQAPISYDAYLPEKSGGRLNSTFYVHTYTRLLPPAKYYKEHPEYYALQRGKRVKQTVTFGTVCYTNPEVPRLMAEKIRQEIRKSPELRYFSVSVNDTAADYCECPNCAPVIKKIGTAGIQLMLANKVAEILCKEYPDIRITTLVYGSGKLNAGKIKAHPNVTLFLAPIGARYNVVQMLIPLSENPVIVESIRECRRSTDHIFFWDYLDTTSYPFPNFDQVKETLRFLAEQKVEGYSVDVTKDGRALTPLKKWVFSQLAWNPSADMDALISEFIFAYYGKAAPEIQEYVNLMRRAWRHFKAAYDKAGGDGVMLVYSGKEKSAMRKLLDAALQKAKDDDVLTGRIAREYLAFLVMELAQNSKVCGVEKYRADYELANRLLTYAPWNHFIRKEKLNIRWKNKLAWATKKLDANLYSPDTVVVSKAILGAHGGPYTDDPAALDGKATRHRGKGPWGVQWKYFSFIDYLIPGKTYVLRMRVRAECKKTRTSGPMFDLRAFHHGNHSLNKKQPGFHAEFTPEDVDGKYRWIVLGKVEFKNPAATGMFWMNSLVDLDEALWYDRLELIPIEDFKELSNVPDRTIIL